MAGMRPGVIAQWPESRHNTLVSMPSRCTSERSCRRSGPMRSWPQTSKKEEFTLCVPALLVAPLLVFASYGFGTPLDLIFTPFEVAAVTMSVLIFGFVSMDGESHWMEGVMLVGVYAMLAIAFYFLPA
mgnify:CR=1 FL=1